MNQINNWTGPDGTGSLSSVTAFTGATVSANNAVIYIANGSAVTVLGSGNTIYTSGGDDVYVSGGGNTINANGAGDKIAVGNTFGNMDTINASGDTSGSWAADGQQAGIYISDGTQANITGWNDFVVAGNAVNVNLIGGDNSMSIGSNALAGISGTAGSPDSIYSNGNGAGGLTAMGNAAGLWLSDGAQANLSGGDNRVWVNNYATLNADGANNAIVMGTNALVGISGTQGFADTVTSNWNTTGGFTALNQAAGIWVGDGAQANLEGGNNQLWAGNYATLNANGPSNIVSMGMNDLFGANGTNGGYDTVYANWDTSGGFTALGQSAGVWVGSGAQVNLNGSNDQLWQNSFANLNAAGANNVISMGNNALLGLSGTAGGYDTVQANWDTVGGMTSMGNPAGIWLAPSAQANINGEHNQVWANGSDSANVFGAANRINATAGDRIWLSQTGSNADAVFSNSANFQSSTGDGLPSGIYLDGATYAVLNGNSNGLRLSNNDYLAIFGSGNNVVGGIANALSVYGNYNTSSLSSSIENIYDGSYNNFTGSTVQFGNDGGYNYYNGTLYGNRVDNYDDGDDPSQLFEWAQYADEPWEDGEGDGTFTLDAVERENLAGLASGEDRLEKLALGNGQRSEADASAMQPIASVPPQPLASDTQSARLIEAMAAFSPSSTSSATFPVSTDDVAHPVQLAAAHP
ncbi:hypothetical protein DFO45_0830 [Azorhizobium sp. AG788]|nr:hypothetical protein DFO45_0830 [Azorhizobium sp. AG788]